MRDFKDLIDKNILYISIKTFNYEKEIKSKLVSLGAKVDYYDERPSNSIFVKGLIRVRKSLLNKRIYTYYNHILMEIKGKKYDYFFLIKGEVIPLFFLKELRKLLPDCKFIYYTWDSFDNNPNAILILPFFDKKMSFDNNDALKYNLEFRPLFYIDKYKEVRSSNNYKFKYDLMFLGTAHSDRYRISNALVNWCDKNNFKSLTYYYLPSRIVYFIKSLFDKSFKEFNYSKLSFKSLKFDEIIALYRESSTILDINHPDQRGLTMRTFEALGAEKKIITTNKEIKKYQFYNENNIFVINRENINLSIEFFNQPFKPLDNDLIYEMSISGWLKSIFVSNKSSYWIK